VVPSLARFWVVMYTGMLRAFAARSILSVVEMLLGLVGLNCDSGVGLGVRTVWGTHKLRGISLGYRRCWGC
jgi:hypothetical protein